MRRIITLIVFATAIGVVATTVFVVGVRSYHDHYFFAQTVADKKGWRTRFWSEERQISTITSNGLPCSGLQTLVRVSNNQGLVAYQMFRFEYAHAYGTNEDAIRYFARELNLLAKNDQEGLARLGYVLELSAIDLHIPSTTASPVPAPTIGQ